MKKIPFLLFVALLATGCAVGTYQPWAHNNFGAQTTVVLDKANFRVVRDVEAVVEVNNSNLKRQDVEKSAYGQLLQNARLTGSQVLINVVIEEIVRDKMSFRSVTNRKQYVAARATVIEFLKENGRPIESDGNASGQGVPSQDNLYRTAPQTEATQAIQKQENTVNNPKIGLPSNDLYFIAWMVKTEKISSATLDSIKDDFNIDQNDEDKINLYIGQNSVSDLQKKSLGHNQTLNKYLRK